MRASMSWGWARCSHPSRARGVAPPMAKRPKPNTQESTDATAVKPPSAWRLQALQVVAGILIVAAIVLLLRGLLTPASSGGATSGQKTPGVSATATAAPAAPLVGHYAPDVTVRDMRD